MDPDSLYQVLDQLIERYATDADPRALQAARRAFEARRGRVFEDEEMWEMASRCFVECYVLESHGGGHPPAVAALSDPGIDAGIVRAWLRSQRSLYRVGSLSPTVAVVEDLIAGGSYQVKTPRSFRGVDRGDVIEARLVGVGEDVFFGTGFVFHPSGAHEAICRHIRAILAAGGERRDAVDFCANLRVRCERYGHVTPLRLYESTVVDPDKPGYGLDAGTSGRPAG